MAISKGKEIELLSQEANKLRKDAHERWKQTLSGKITSTEFSQDELRVKAYLLMQVAFQIEIYADSIPGKYREVNVDEVIAYRKIAVWVRQLLP